MTYEIDEIRKYFDETFVNSKSSYHSNSVKEGERSNVTQQRILNTIRGADESVNKKFKDSHILDKKGHLEINPDFGDNDVPFSEWNWAECVEYEAETLFNALNEIGYFNSQYCAVMKKYYDEESEREKKALAEMVLREDAFRRGIEYIPNSGERMENTINYAIRLSYREKITDKDHVEKFTSIRRIDDDSYSIFMKKLDSFNYFMNDKHSTDETSRNTYNRLENILANNPSQEQIDAVSFDLAKRYPYHDFIREKGNRTGAPITKLFSPFTKGPDGKNNNEVCINILGLEHHEQLFTSILRCFVENKYPKDCRDVYLIKAIMFVRSIIIGKSPEGGKRYTIGIRFRLACDTTDIKVLNSIRFEFENIIFPKFEEQACLPERTYSNLISNFYISGANSGIKKSPFSSSRGRGGKTFEPRR